MKAKRKCGHPTNSPGEPNMERDEYKSSPLNADMGTSPLACYRQRGTTMIEYSLLVALLAVVCVSAMSYVGVASFDTFDRVGKSVGVSDVPPPPPPPG